jgi:hypothetical protein
LKLVFFDHLTPIKTSDVLWEAIMGRFRTFGYLLLFLCSACVFARDYEFANFLVSQSFVGPIKKGMSVRDVMEFLPDRQIKKVVGHGEFAEDEYDDYEIYDSSGKHILTITPVSRNDLDQKISRIEILDTRFKTDAKIGLGSSYGEIIKRYAKVDASPDIEVIVLQLPKINAWMSIDKNKLSEDWWDNSRKHVDLNRIPLEARTGSFVIWWN